MREPLELIVLFDFKDPGSYLALAPTRALLERTALPGHWYPFLGSPLRAPHPLTEDADRGVLHRHHRASYTERDLCRYAQIRQLPARHFHDGGLYRQSSGELAAMGFNWVAQSGPDAAQAYLGQVFEGYWDGELDLDALTDVQQLLSACGCSTEDFEAYCQAEGVAQLATQRATAVEAGGFATPGCILDGEAFIGRQHLPYLEKRILESTGNGKQKSGRN